MSRLAAATLRIPAMLALVGVALVAAIPWAMSRYRPYAARPGVDCIRTDVPATVHPPFPSGMCEPLSALYRMPAAELVADAAIRSLALLLGAAVLAATVGVLLGALAGLLRRRAFASGAILATAAVLAAVPAFFVAYFLQTAVVLLGTSEGRGPLPVFGFGLDEHIVLPLLSISVPAVAYTAQITGTRVAELLDADFVTVARAKGLRMTWILPTHVLPHVRPVALEGLSSGLRVSVASLPIVEYLFVWRGIGQLALEAVGVHDPAVLILSALVLAGLFAILSSLAEISRPAALYARE